MAFKKSTSPLSEIIRAERLKQREAEKVIRVQQEGLYNDDLSEDNASDKTSEKSDTKRLSIFQ